MVTSSTQLIIKLQVVSDLSSIASMLRARKEDKPAEKIDKIYKEVQLLCIHNKKMIQRSSVRDCIFYSHDSAIGKMYWYWDGFAEGNINLTI